MKIKFKLTKKDHVKAIVESVRVGVTLSSILKENWKMFFFTYGIIVIYILAYNYNRYQRIFLDMFDVGILLFATFMYVLGYQAYLWFVRIKANITMNKALGDSPPQETEVALSRDHLRVTHDEGRYKFSEPFIKRFIESSDYLVCMGNEEFQDYSVIVPKRAFATEQDLNEFKDKIQYFILKEHE